MDYQKIKIKIFIDCNFNRLGLPDQPIVSPFSIKQFGLKEGDAVIGYQDEQEWEGIVRFDSSQPEEMEWYIELDFQKEHAVSKERMEGRSEGFWSGIPIGEISGETAVATAMLSDGIDVDTVNKYTRLSQTRLRNILNSIKK